MRIVSDENLRNFHFWSGAIDTANHLTLEQLDEIENVLIDMYPEGISDTWFDEDFVAKCLGYNDWEDFLENGEVD